MLLPFKWWSERGETRTFIETIRNKIKIRGSCFHYLFNRFYKFEKSSLILIT